jgi:hypothetical protein
MRRIVTVLASVVLAAGFLMASVGPASAAPANGRLEAYPSDVPIPYCLTSNGNDVGDTLRVTTVCLGNDNQLFTVDGNAIAPIRLDTGKCLDVQGAGVGNLTRVQIWNCNLTVAQLWQFVPIPGTGNFLIQNPNSGLCLISNLEAAVISDCNPRLTIAPDGGRNMFKLVAQL